MGKETEGESAALLNEDVGLVRLVEPGDDEGCD